MPRHGAMAPFLAVVPAALLLVASATGAGADGGLPHLTDVHVGPYHAALHNDSPALHRGANTLTVEIPSLPPGQLVELWLRSPAGVLIDVPLKPVAVLGGGDTHAAHDPQGGQEAHAAVEHLASVGHTAAAAPAAAPAPPAPAGHNHGDAQAEAPATALPTAVPATTAASVASDGHTDHVHNDAVPDGPAATYLGRGAVTLPTTGVWHAVVRVGAHHDMPFEAEAPLEAEDGGPNPLYLGATGSLIGGSVLYGAVRRRRAPATTAAPSSTPKRPR